MDRDPPTCGLTATVADVRDLLEGSRYGFCLVLEGRVLLGRVRRSAIEDVAGTSTVESVMEPGPSTVRFNTRPDELIERLAAQDLRTAIVTTPTGCLIGVFHRSAD
ncbi:MAG: CBS domain-containing protein [Thermoleophilaceae bacterium]